MNRKLVSFLTISLILVAGAHPTAARAVNGGGEIPGVPLPSTQLVSKAGGDIIDQVWRVELEKGKIALIRVDGEPGAELGLYLFSGDATSVVTSTPLRKSAQPGASQVITASLPAGTYYINVNGRNQERAYTFTLATSLYEDVTPPMLSATFATGLGKVSTDYVDVKTNAVDLLSGTPDIRYKVDSPDWTEWRAYSESLRIPLSPEERTYQIDIQVRNGVGLLSAVTTLYATVDRTPPTATLTSVFTDGIALEPRPKIEIQYDEAMNISSVRPSVNLRELSGAFIPLKCAYNSESRSSSCRPTVDLALGKSYLVEHVGARDLAGNLSMPISPLSLTYYKNTTVSLELGKREAIVGEVLQVSVRTFGIPDKSIVMLQARTTQSGEWENVSGMRIADGIGRAILTPSLTKEYRAVFLGSPLRAPSQSGTKTLLIMPRVSIENPSSSFLSRRSDRIVKFSASVDPAIGPVQFVIIRCTNVFRNCVVHRKEELSVDQGGRVQWTWVTERGYWKFRVATSAQEGLSASATSPIRITVR